MSSCVVRVRVSGHNEQRELWPQYCVEQGDQLRVVWKITAINEHSSLVAHQDIHKRRFVGGAFVLAHDEGGQRLGELHDVQFRMSPSATCSLLSTTRTRPLGWKCQWLCR